MLALSHRTLNQIINEFKGFADNHRFIHSFSAGTFDDFATSGDTKYPAMWVQYESSGVDAGSNFFTFKIGLFDRVKKDRSNLQEVLSDTNRTALDFKTWMSIPEYGFRLTFSEFTPLFEPYHEDEISGWEFNVTVTQPFLNDKCAIPFINNPTPITGFLPSAGTYPNLWVPSSRTLTINGVAYDLSADRSWSVAWGSISGTLSDQTDLQNALDAKVPTTRDITINGDTQDLSNDRSYSVDLQSVANEGNVSTIDIKIDVGNDSDAITIRDTSVTNKNKISLRNSDQDSGIIRLYDDSENIKIELNGKTGRITGLPLLIAAVNTTAFTSASTGVNEVAHAHLISAGTISTIGSIIMFSVKCSSSNTANNKAFRMWINTTPNLSGSPVQLALVTATTNAVSLKFERFFNVMSTTSLLCFASPTTSLGQETNSTVAPSVVTVPSLTSSFYLIISVNRANAGDTAQVLESHVNVQQF